MPIVINKAAHVHAIGAVRLIPGTNHVPDDVWEKVASHPLVKIHLEGWAGNAPTLELLEVRTVKSKGRVADSVPDLSSLEPKMANKLVTETYRIEVLGEWQKSETRQSVLNAIAKQIAALQAPMGEGT